MKTIAKFFIFPEHVGNELFSKLVQILPEGRSPRSLDVSLPEGDERLNAILRHLAEGGFRPWINVGRPKETDEISMRIERTYGPGDLKGLEYLYPAPKVSIDSDADRSETGVLQVNAKRLKPQVDFGSTEMWGIVVSSRMKELMEAAQLLHVVFREIEVTGKDEDRHQGLWWELDSDLILPPLSPTCVLVNGEGEPYDILRDPYGHLIEGLYRPAEFHYTESAIKAAGPFDYAKTREKFGIPEFCRGTVASRRFYEFCLEHNVKMGGIPVRIDPDSESIVVKEETPTFSTPSTERSKGVDSAPSLMSRRASGTGTTTACIGPVDLEDMDQQLREELAAIYPEGIGDDEFECNLPGEDPRASAVVETLEQWGYIPEPWFEGTEEWLEPRFPYSLVRRYNAEDFGKAKYLEVFPTASFGNHPSPSQVVRIDAARVPGHEPVARVNDHRVVVSEGVRSLLAEADLRHAVVRRAEVTGKLLGRWSGKWRYWELTSDLILPPISPRCELIDQYGEPFEEGPHKACYLSEGRHPLPEVHYQKADLNSIDPFDLAVTHEQFGHPDFKARRLIASKRFYQLCAAQNLKINWVPVRVDSA